MLSIIISKIKSVPGATLPVELTASVDCASYGYPEMSFAEPVTFLGQVTNNDGVLVVSGQASGLLERVCDRCGEHFTKPCQVVVEVAYAGQGATGDPDPNGELDVQSFSGETIDITEAVLRQLFLELPMKSLCRDDCRGLCPQCGINLNYDQCSCCDDEIDPRLEILKKFVCDSEKGV